MNKSLLPPPLRTREACWYWRKGDEGGDSENRTNLSATYFEFRGRFFERKNFITNAWDEKQLNSVFRISFDFHLFHDSLLCLIDANVI